MLSFKFLYSTYSINICSGVFSVVEASFSSSLASHYCFICFPLYEVDLQLLREIEVKPLPCNPTIAVPPLWLESKFSSFRTLLHVTARCNAWLTIYSLNFVGMPKIFRQFLLLMISIELKLYSAIVLNLVYSHPNSSISNLCHLSRFEHPANF